MLSAACAGVPIVASDIPANREAAAQAGHHGICFVSRRASPFAIADAVKRLSGPGHCSRADLVPTWQSVGEQTVSIYDEVLSNGR